MRPLPLALLAALALPPGAPRAEEARLRGLDVPEAARERWLRDSELTVPPAPVTERCAVYRTWALVWTNDPGLMGAERLEVRARPPGTSAERVCAAGFAGRRLLAADPDAQAARYPVGGIGRWLVLQTADGLGELIGIGVVDLQSGRAVLDAGYHYARGIDFARTARGIAATYWQQLEELPCVPRAGDPACWTRIRRQHGIPAKVPAPDCEEAVRRAGPIDRPSASLQITVHVRRTLPGGATELLADRPTCDPTP